MIKMTADAAHKMVKNLEDEKRILVNNIRSYSVFNVSIAENPEEARPEFDFVKIYKRIEEINRQVMKIKLARSKFNVDTKLSSGLTIGESLVRMATLRNELYLYSELANRQPKIRKGSSNGSEVEYQYANYDIAYAKEVYEKTNEEIVCIQKELNIINTSKEFEVDIDL